jgi:hypothetical protein
VRKPGDWSPNIVQGKTVDLSTGEGLRIWSDVMARIGGRTVAEPAPEGARYGAGQVIRPRLGQGTFRVLVTDTYRRRCAVTGERTLPVLEAAHVRPYAEGGRHEVANGILLRSDLHTLFVPGSAWHIRAQMAIDALDRAWPRRPHSMLVDYSESVPHSFSRSPAASLVSGPQLRARFEANGTAGRASHGH